MAHESIRIGTIVRGKPYAQSYLRQIREHGFECYQILFWENLGGIDPARFAAEVRPIVEEHGAVISSLGMYGNPLETDASAAECRKAWETLIDFAPLFGTDIVAGFTGRLRGRPIPDSLPRFRVVFGELARRAADRGVRIAFENCDMGGGWQSGDWNIAHNPAAWELMFDVLPNENVGLEWDPSHEMLKLIDPLPQIAEWGARLFHVHGKDCAIRWDVVRSYGVTGAKPFAEERFPGLGDTNWAQVISELVRIGYQGTIDIEGWHDPVYCDELELTGQVNALDYLKRCRGRRVANPRREERPASR